MKKLLLMLSIFCTCLCSFSSYDFNENKSVISEYVYDNEKYNSVNSVVRVTNKDESISANGVILANNGEDYYIATSYDIYNIKETYRLEFNDGNILESSILGLSKENKVMILKVTIHDRKYQVSNIKNDEKMYVGEEVNLLARNKGEIYSTNKHISYVGACRNDQEDTFKKYYYSKIYLNENLNYLGYAVFSNEGNLLGIITDKNEKERFQYSIVDSNKLLEILKKLLINNKYVPNFIRHNLADVSSLSLHERYLYSIKDNIYAGVVVTSVNYLNLFVFGLNQGMVILQVEGNDVYNCYDFDYEISKYKKGSYIHLKVLTIVGLYRSIVVKI